MKNLFYAVLALSLLFVSCNREEEFEDIDSKENAAANTRAGEGSVSVTLTGNTLKFTWDNRNVERISILITDQNNNTIHYVPFFITGTKSSYTYNMFTTSGYFTIQVNFIEPAPGCYQGSQTWYCDHGRIFRSGSQPQCKHDCFRSFPSDVHVNGTSIDLRDLHEGEYTMVIYSSEPTVQRILRDFTIIRNPMGNYVHISKIGGGVNVSQKVRIYPKGCPYGPEVCFNYIETSVRFDNSNGYIVTDNGRLRVHYRIGYGYY